jgi:hypothetical protein
MDDYKRKRAELERLGFAEEKFEKPMDCKNNDQNRLVYTRIQK